MFNRDSEGFYRNGATGFKRAQRKPRTRRFSGDFHEGQPESQPYVASFANACGCGA